MKKILLFVRKILKKHCRPLYKWLYSYVRSSGVLKKVTTGTQFDRFAGLDYLLKGTTGKSVFDFACCEGFVSYEFARAGAAVNHGIDIDKRRIKFAKQLFLHVPNKHMFEAGNLAISGKEFKKKYKKMLLPQYDIMLYLGVYHHIIQQGGVKKVNHCLKTLLDMTGEYFAIRTHRIPEIESIIKKSGFKLVHKHTQENVGELRIYKRTKK